MKHFLLATKKLSALPSLATTVQHFSEQIFILKFVKNHCTVSLTNNHAYLCERRIACNLSDLSDNQIYLSSSLNNTNLKASNNYVLINKDDQNKSNNNDKNKKATLEQLLNLKQVLTDFLPRFLTDTHPYILYSPDLVFENFYFDPPKITVGLSQYALQLTVIRWKVNWKFSHAKLQLLKITHDEQEGTIKVRWRINGVRAAKTFFQPWKIKIWNVKETFKQNDNEENWIDGFSILYVRGDGIIYKHRIQRVIGQKEEEPVVANKKILPNVDLTT
jgi:hypothetical protein